jgi:hypothetical protein
MVDAATAIMLAMGWSDVCEIARTLHRREPTAPTLADAAIAECLSDLDKAHERAAAKISPVESPPEAGDAGATQHDRR